MSAMYYCTVGCTRRTVNRLISGHHSRYSADSTTSSKYSICSTHSLHSSTRLAELDSDSTKSLFNRTAVDVKVPNDQGNEETLNIQATLTERLLVVEVINKVTHDKFGRNFEMGDLKALGFQGKPIHFFNMLTDSLKLHEDGTSNLTCAFLFWH
eukprot:1394178-Amorphochlora_amoeboformis.AAC.1